MHSPDQLKQATHAAGLSAEELYLQIWEREQAHTQTRWSVTTFFVSISFAIFGFSLQTAHPPVPPIVSHSVALAIYWFAFVLFWRFNSFTNCLRAYLREMEAAGRVEINVQTRVNAAMRGQYSKWLSTFNLMLYFGILYSAAVGLLWWQRVG
jgi:hypothetical protein